MSQYTAMYCDQQGLGYRELVLRYKICIVIKGSEAAGLCRDIGSQHGVGRRGAGLVGRGAGREGAERAGEQARGAVGAQWHGASRQAGRRALARGTARRGMRCAATRQLGAATRLGSPTTTRRQCASGRACAHLGVLVRLCVCTLCT